MSSRYTLLKSRPSLSTLETRREREARALQKAWEEHARCHELLTRAGVAAGSLHERIAELLGELREAKATGVGSARATGASFAQAPVPGPAAGVEGADDGAPISLSTEARP